MLNCVQIVVKNIFLPAQKCPYTYSKDEGHKYRLLMKNFYFSCQKYPYIKRNAERHFYSPLMKFFIFRLNEYLKAKKHPPISGERFIKISLFCCL